MRKIDKQKKRLKLLNKAKDLALTSEFVDAMKIINNLLVENEVDVDALGLKGNVLDLDALRELESNNDVRTSDIENNFNNAKLCYEKILSIDPNNTVALTDLGDYWERKNNYKQSLEMYDKAIELLKNGHYYLSPEDEFENAYWGKIELLKEMGKDKEALKCKHEALKWCPNSELFK